MGNADMAAEYPHGHLNCGLAHGIPGPLGTMSLALLAGVTVPGLPAAVEVAASWLAGHEAVGDWGVDWPVAVPLAASGAADASAAAGRPNRSGWCYGAPGVSRALWLRAWRLTGAAGGTWPWRRCRARAGARQPPG